MYKYELTRGRYRWAYIDVKLENVKKTAPENSHSAKVAILPRSISAYFTRGDYNIIIVDYGSLVREPCLSQISWGPDFCSQCIAQLVKYLKNHPRGTRVENIHVLGYSVGAHIGGLIANYLPNDKLGRITGNCSYAAVSQFNCPDVIRVFFYCYGWYQSNGLS